MPRRSAFVLIAVLGALIAPGATQAATTLGALPSAPPAPFIPCAAIPPIVPGMPTFPGYVVWEGTASTSSSVVPAGGGVVTSMRTAHAGAPGSPVEFKVLRPGPGQLAQVATVPAILGSDGSASADTQIPVQAGDVLAITNGAGGIITCIWQSPTPTDTVKLALKPADDVTPIPDPPVVIPFANTRANVAGTLEPDADRDGFGDESQDSCATDASTQGACGTDASLSASAVERQVTVGDLQVVTYRVNVASSSGAARGSRLSVGLPSGVDVIASSSSAGSCSGALTCDLGDLPAGSSAVIVAVLRATAAGAKALAASVSTSTTDLNPSNNGANVAFDVAAPVVQAAAQSVAPAAVAPRRCRVVRLANLSQTAARKALVAGGCRLGKVTKPKKIRKGARLRVRRQSIPHGLEGPVGTKVDVTLKQVGGKKAAKKKRKR